MIMLLIDSLIFWSRNPLKLINGQNIYDLCAMTGSFNLLSC